jgi:hypothetical protein
MTPMTSHGSPSSEIERPRIAEDGDARRGRGVLAFGERAAEYRAYAEDVEHVGRDARGLESLGLAVTREVRGAVVVRGETGEGRHSGAEVEEVGNGERGNPVPRRAEDPHQLVGRGEWERPQQDGVDGAEDRRVGADA